MKYNSKILDFFASMISSKLGIVYSKENYFQLESRLTEIIRQGGFADAQELYQKALFGTLGEYETLLLDVATNNETSFFRDPGVWRNLTKRILDNDQFLEGRQNRIRIWCAASSYGQEPYTLAMILHEIKQKRPGLHCSILASDISERALSFAKRGCYSQLQIQRGLPAAKLIKYFGKTGVEDGLPNWQLKDEILRMVKFEKINILDDWNGIGPFDLILCRNVLIYQSIENKQKAIEKFFDLLSYDGTLMLGGSESLIGIESKFKLSTSDGLLLYNKVLEPQAPRKLA